MKKAIFEALGGTYTEVDEVLIPDLELSSAAKNMINVLTEGQTNTI